MRRAILDAATYTRDDGLAHLLGQIENIEQKVYAKKYRNIV